MSNKRKLDDYLGGNKQEIKPVFKNSLDSDEEDDEAATETYNIMTAREIHDAFIKPAARDDGDDEVTEDSYDMPPPSRGVPVDSSSTRFTAFNMKEELEEGHFDKEGHYHWKKELEIRDNWLDEIDQVQIKPVSNPKGVEESESDDDEMLLYDPNPVYQRILEHLQPGETISKALRRIGKGMKQLSTADRWKRKKNPDAYKEHDEASSLITSLTELANEILKRTGNMNIYEESYEQIKKLIDASKKSSHPSKQEAELDMYADDFDEREASLKQSDTDTLKKDAPSQSTSSQEATKLDEGVAWELKWSQTEEAEVTGPHSSQAMQAWSKEGYFKKGAWVRKLGQQGEFFNASRIDFELYCD